MKSALTNIRAKMTGQLAIAVLILIFNCTSEKRGYHLFDDEINDEVSLVRHVPLRDGESLFYLTDSTTLVVVISDGEITEIASRLRKSRKEEIQFYKKNAKQQNCDFEACYAKCVEEKGGADKNFSCYFQCFGCRVSEKVPPPKLVKY